MKRLFTFSFLFIALACVSARVYLIGQAKSDDFSSVVKVIEQFYGVKHKGLPFLARAGIKTATAVGRLAGGPKRQLAEAGSVKVAFFEDQDFNSRGGYANFKASMNEVLGSWSPFIQVAAGKDDEQTYIYLRESGEKFNVLVITIERREGSVVQVTLSPRTLATLMKDPNEMGRTITVEATTEDE